MKWTNRGHEFDAFWDEIKDIKKVYLFGAGISGQSVFKCLKDYLQVAGFIDNEPQKQGKIIHNLKINKLDEVVLNADEAVIITVSPEKVSDIMRQLEAKGIRAYDMHIFLPVYYAYQLGQVLFTSISYLPTTVCNLNCRYCLNFSPYMKKQEFRKIDKLKQDLDLFFKVVDKVLLFHVSGGEPFLYPDLAELLLYIHQKYGNQIIRFETTTNGTVVPGKELCDILKECNVAVVLDDYRDEIKLARDRFNEIESMFRQYGVNYRIQKADTWIDLNPKKNAEETEAGILIKKFDECHVPWQEYRDGKLYLCNYADYASVAGLYSTNEVEMFSFWDRELDLNEKKALMEFRLGFSQKGYVDFCGQCDGFSNNPNLVKPAEQMSHKN